MNQPQRSLATNKKGNPRQETTNTQQGGRRGGEGLSHRLDMRANDVAEKKSTPGVFSGRW